MLKSLFPEHKSLFANWQEDLEDTRVLRGHPAQRVFRAIREGNQLQSEICRRADVTAQYLDEMLEAGVLTTIEQGGKTDGARGARKKIYRVVEAEKSAKTAYRSNARSLAPA